VELETQNETLRLTQAALEASRNRYLDLYESAPVAYFTVNLSGQITEINRAGVELLGEDKSTLLNNRIESFVEARDQSAWRQYFEQSLKGGGTQTRELSMRRRNGTLFFGYLHSMSTHTGEGVSELRIAMADITHQRKADEVRRRFETRLRSLTKREREVLVLALSGTPNSAIAARLRLNRRTIENHRARIYRKTGVASLLELVQEALAAGVPLDEIANSLTPR
jgi:PAS domain S-box-containing protein